MFDAVSAHSKRIGRYPVTNKMISLSPACRHFTASAQQFQVSNIFRGEVDVLYFHHRQFHGYYGSILHWKRGAVCPASPHASPGRTDKLHSSICDIVENCFRRCNTLFTFQGNYLQYLFVRHPFFLLNLHFLHEYKFHRKKL